jgi:hypothetical protein
MASKITVYSNTSLRSTLDIAAEDSAALLERNSPKDSDSAAARGDFWKEHQEDLALIAARATDAASPLLPAQDEHAWIIIASAIYELIEAVCLDSDPAAKPTRHRPLSDAAVDPNPQDVEAALEQVGRASTTES